MAGRLDSRDYTTPLVGRFILRQLDRRAPCGDPHLEADNRAGHLAEQRRVHLGARPWRIGADARFMRRGQSVELCYQFRSEEHTSELQSLMRISYAVFCLKKKKNTQPTQNTYTNTH